jgi:hypothetical protein
MRFVLTATALFALATVPAGAQWLDHPTPGIPRTGDGKPNLNAPTPRMADGKPDFSGVWRGSIQVGHPAVDSQDMQPWVREVVRQRADQFFKTRPMTRVSPVVRRPSAKP